MRSLFQWLPLLELLSALHASPVLSSAIPEPAITESSLQARSQAQTHIEGSKWYDWGWYGAFPRMTYESFGAQSPWPSLLQTDDRCDDGYLFIEPRGVYVETPGPIMLDNTGNLVWMQTLWGQAMDVKVQQFQGKDYITFWHGTDNGTFGEGYYIMVSGPRTEPAAPEQSCARLYRRVALRLAMHCPVHCPLCLCVLLTRPPAR